jgi:hypothetical protein
MFLVAHDYLYEISYHKDFRNWLYKKQDEEDAAERKAYVDGVTEEALRMMREDLQHNPKLLSTPAPECLLKIFEDVKPIPQCSAPMRFARPSKADRLKWQEEHVQRLRNQLNEAEKDWEALQSE